MRSASRVGTRGEILAAFFFKILHTVRNPPKPDLMLCGKCGKMRTSISENSHRDFSMEYWYPWYFHDYTLDYTVLEALELFT